MDLSALSMTGTFSKHPRAWGLPSDLYVERGVGAEVYLSDGWRYLDWVCGLGTNLLGYSDHQFITAVQNQVAAGGSFSLPHRLEYQVAEQLVHLLATHVPGWSSNKLSVRFGKTGSDACAMAVRLARACTGKRSVASFGYHGWQAEFAGAMSPGHGLPPDYKHRGLLYEIQWNQPESVEYAMACGDIATLIVEHPAQETHAGWYDFLRRLCDENHCLLIMDEIVTGLRYGLGGAAERYGVSPDIVIMGKGLGNGLPISAVIAGQDIMNWFARTHPVFCSSTHFGEAVSLAAAGAVLSMWDAPRVTYLWNAGQELMDGLIKAGWSVSGHPPRSLLNFEDDYQRAFFVQGLFRHRILMNRPNFVSLAHDYNSVHRTVQIAEAIRSDMLEIGTKLPSYIEPEQLPVMLFRSR